MKTNSDNFEAEFNLDVYQSFFRLIKTKYKYYTLSFFVAVVVCVALIPFFYSLSVLPLIFVCLAGAVGANWLQNKINNDLVQEFVRINNLSYVKPGRPEDEIGALFKIGSYRKIFNSIKGVFEGREFKLFNYSYDLGGNESTSVKIYTVFDIEFNCELPRIFLDFHRGKREDFLVGDLVYLPQASVEFEQKFKLYATKGQQLVALQIFTPDLMAKLLDFDRQFDIELAGNQIYIYDRGGFVHLDAMQDMFRVAKHVIANVGRVVEKMK